MSSGGYSTFMDIIWSKDSLRCLLRSTGNASGIAAFTLVVSGGKVYSNIAETIAGVCPQGRRCFETGSKKSSAIQGGRRCSLYDPPQDKLAVEPPLANHA
ncbi:hypothetical protein FA13DRAFT_1736293, partial [Coprinellus micaceus]